MVIRLTFRLLLVVLLLLVPWGVLPEIVTAAVGINKTVSFQGKLVNSNGTNVTDGDYNLEFKIYQGGDGVPGGGDETLKWTETRTGSNKVTVTDGIFRVNLGSVTAFGSSVDWNQDTLWLSVNVGGTGSTPSWDGEMNPFIRFTATPYAFNALFVNGLTVTNTADNPFSSTTTLKIGDGKTVIVNNSVTLSGTDGTTITFPNANDTVVVLDLAQTLTNKTIGSTGLVFSSASTDITTVSNENFAIIPNGTGNVGIGITNPIGKFVVSNTSQTAIGKSLVIFDQYEAQDLFTASSSGVTKFVLSASGSVFLAAGAGIDAWSSGTIIIGGGTNTTGVTLGKSGGTLTLPQFTGNNAVLFATSGTGVLSAATTSTSGLCLLSGSGAAYTPTWSTCPSGGGGGGSSNWTLDSGSGVLYPINNTLDILFGGTATSSAKFGFLNINSETPTASISASSGNNATYLTGTGTLATTNMQALTLGGATTGSLSLAAGSSVPALFIANGGNVGIGTSIPATALHLAKDDASTNTQLELSRIVRTTSGTAADDIGAYTSFQIEGDQGTNVEAGRLGFVLRDANNATGYGGEFLVSTWRDSSSQEGIIEVLSAYADAANKYICGNSTRSNGPDCFSFTIGTGNVAKFSFDGTPRLAWAYDEDVTNRLTIRTDQNTDHLYFKTLSTQPISFDTNNDGQDLIIASTGNIGIGTTSPGSKFEVVSSSDSSADLSHIINTTGTSSSSVDGLQIDFQTSGTTASADNSGLRINITRGNTGSSSTLEGIYIGDLGGGDHANVTTTALRIGTGWERGIVIESGGSTGEGFAYTGAGRPVKTLTLSPEYPGAVLTASDSATTIGTMTSDASPSAALSNFQQYYEWNSSQSSLQDYTIAVRITLPKDFSAWATADTAMTIRFNTELTSSNANKLDVLVYNTDTSLSASDQGTPVVYRQAQVSTTQKTWTTITITASELDSGTARDIDAAGETMVIYLKLYSKDNNYVQVGDIVLNYLAKF